MNDRLDIQQIHEFWTRQALTHGSSPAASWSDQTAIDLEVRTLLTWLSDGDRVLDIGCANGYSTVRLAARRALKITGIDYVPEMIAQARDNLRLQATNLAGTVDFRIGDIMQLDEPDGAYDKVIVVRVIINLHDWDRQVRGLREALRVIKPGGLLLLSEATLDGWRQLNAFRREWGLPDIPMPSFNAYLDQRQVLGALAPEAELVKLDDFASTYYVGTRVLKPLLSRLVGGAVDVADPLMHWNRWFAMAPAWGDYGVQKLFVLRKT